MVSSAHPRQSGTAAASAGGWLGEQCAGGRTSLALVRVLRRARAGVVATVPLSIPGAILSEEGSNVFGLLVKRGQSSEHQVVSCRDRWAGGLSSRTSALNIRAYVLDRPLIPGVKRSAAEPISVDALPNPNNPSRDRVAAASGASTPNAQRTAICPRAPRSSPTRSRLPFPATLTRLAPQLAGEQGLLVLEDYQTWCRSVKRHRDGDHDRVAEPGRQRERRPANCAQRHARQS